MTAKQSIYESCLITCGRIHRGIPRLRGPMYCPGWLQSVRALRLISLSHASGLRHGIIVYARRSQIRRLEEQAIHGSGKRKSSLLLEDESDKIVGRMLLAQEFLARLKEERSSLNLGDQARRRLMMLKHIIVVGKCIDIR